MLLSNPAHTSNPLGTDPLENDIMPTVANVFIRAGYMVLRINSGMARTPEGQMFSFASVCGTKCNSISDLLCLHATRRAVCIETKTRTGKQRITQKGFEACCTHFGVVYEIARSEEDAKRIVEREIGLHKELFGAIA